MKLHITIEDSSNQKLHDFKSDLVNALIHHRLGFTTRHNADGEDELIVDQIADLNKDGPAKFIIPEIRKGDIISITGDKGTSQFFEHIPEGSFLTRKASKPQMARSKNHVLNGTDFHKLEIYRHAQGPLKDAVDVKKTLRKSGLTRKFLSKVKAKRGTNLLTLKLAAAHQGVAHKSSRVKDTRQMKLKGI